MKRLTRHRHEARRLSARSLGQAMVGLCLVVSLASLTLARSNRSRVGSFEALAKSTSKSGSNAEGEAASHSRSNRETDAKAHSDSKSTTKAQADAAPTAGTTKPGSPSDFQPPAQAPKGSVVGWLELTQTLREGPVPFSWVSREDAGPSLQDVLRQIQTVANGNQYKGLVVYLDSPQLSMTQADRIAQAIKQARAKGKEVLAFSESYDLRSYLVACAADKILLQHKGGVSMNGLSIEEWYLGGMLKKLGVKADLVQIGKYKGAADPMTLEKPSKPWSQNMDRLLDDLYAQVIERITSGRHKTKQQVEQWLANAWAMSDQQLVKAGVVDRLTNRDLINVTEIQFGDKFTWDQSMGLSTAQSSAAPSSPFAMLQMLFAKQQTTTSGPTIAVIHASGPIHSGKSSTSGAFSKESIGSKTLVKLLGKVRRDDHIKGLILRLDSPGGSALASEVMWQAIRQVGQKKPVFASVGHMAASGGYYLVCATDEIYVAPQSIVGSIGVVGGKVVLGGLYDMAGIHVKTRSRGPNAGMFNTAEPFTDAQRKQLHKALKLVYDQFTNRVAIGRGNRIKDISKVAKGRLFSGRKAVDNGLADKIGGVDQAVSAMAKQLGLKTNQYQVLDLPQPMSLQQFLSDAFTVGSPMGGASAPGLGLLAHARGKAGLHQALSASSLLGQGTGNGLAPALTAARTVLGPRGWQQVNATLSGLMLLRHESVLTLMPQAILIR